jgi:hypothetical protein
MKRGIYEAYPTKDIRSYNKNFIDKVYKKYLKKYITPEDRFNHPFNQEMFVKMDKWIADHESLYSKYGNIIRAYLKSCGLTIKDSDGNTQLTTPHYGYITSKVISAAYNKLLLPFLVGGSAWKNEVPPRYDFSRDERGYLKEKRFRDSMMNAFANYSFNQNDILNQQVKDWLRGMVNTIGNDRNMRNDYVKITISGSKFIINDSEADEQNERRASKASLVGKTPLTRKN